MMSTTNKLTFVWEQLQKAILAAELDFSLPDRADVQNAINGSDDELAESLINRFNLIEK